MLSYIDLSRDVVKRMKWDNLYRNPHNSTAILSASTNGTRDGEGSDCKKGQKREGEEGEEKPNIQYWPLEWSGGD